MRRLADWFRKSTGDSSGTTAQLLHAAHERSECSQGETSLQPLEESLFGWLLNADARELLKDDARSEKLQQQLTRRVRHSGLQELPRRPSVLPRLMAAMSHEDSRRGEITGIILSDSSLTADVLEMANTPQFVVRDRSVASVEEAVFLLGEQGIHDVVSTAVMKPLMASRNNQEAVFVRRSWRWGLACAQASELIAKSKGDNSQGYFLVALLPALAYITLFRESRQLLGQHRKPQRPSASLIYSMLRHLGWDTVQKIAELWDLPAQSHAWLLAAERPPSQSAHRPLNDGIILGTREVLRHAQRANMSDEALQHAVRMDAETLAPIQEKVNRILAR